MSRLNVTEENLFNDFHGFAEINGSSREYDHRRLLEYYDEVIKSNPDDSTAYFHRGNAQAALRNLPTAIADYTQAIKLNPQYAEAYNNRGFTYVLLKKEKYSRRHKGLDRSDQAEATRMLKSIMLEGWQKRRLGDEAGAREDFAKARELDPNLGNTGE